MHNNANASNNLKGLNDILFAQLRKLESASKADLRDEIDRAEMMTSVSRPILSAASLVLDAQKLKFSMTETASELPNMLEAK
jgi:hypothetical protein